MAKQYEPDPKFDAMTARLAHREAQRRAAEELNTTSSLEAMLARISAEVTATAASRSAGTASGKVGQDAAAPKLLAATASSRRP